MLFDKNNQTVVTVSVVIHVLYKNAAQNISNAQRYSHIVVLNEDFRKLNPDVNKRIKFTKE